MDLYISMNPCKNVHSTVHQVFQAKNKNPKRRRITLDCILYTTIASNILKQKTHIFCTLATQRDKNQLNRKRKPHESPWKKFLSWKSKNANVTNTFLLWWWRFHRITVKQRKLNSETYGAKKRLAVHKTDGLKAAKSNGQMTKNF